METAFTPSKRSHERSPAESNGRAKWQKTGNLNPFGNVVFRILCRASKAGSLIGKGGAVISQIRKETGAKIRVEEIVGGCDERVVVIGGTDKEVEVSTEVDKEDGDKEGSVPQEEKEDRAEGDEEKGNDNAEVAKETISSLKKALLLVSERMLEAEPEVEEDEGDNDKTVTSFAVRLLVGSSQVECLSGKGGSVIKQISADSGAQIRVLPKNKLPKCALNSDELVQISGEVGAVRKALQSVSQQLLDNPSTDHDPLPAKSVGPSSNPPAHKPFTSRGTPYVAGPRDLQENCMPGPMKASPGLLTYRLLCHDERVGGVIGKGGTIIRALKQETGCDIRVMEGVSGSDDRIIVISGPAHPDDRMSAPQDAVLRVQTRIVQAIPDANENGVMARLLVSSNQIGCLLGKGGGIMVEMRNLSGAHIRILGKDQIPKCASENEEVIQINGEYEALQEALVQITSRLRHHFFRDAFPSLGHRPHPAFLDQVPPFPRHMGRRELSPPFHSFQNFDGIGPPPHVGFHPRDDHPPFMHNIHRPGMPLHMSERKFWGPQGFIEGGAPIGLPDFLAPPPRRVSGFGINHPAVITSTTVEVIVPRSLVPVIVGEDGACLKQIRQISDAKITITEPKAGAMETVIIIAGTPEQTHAAQSLIQAFVMSEKEATLTH